MAAVARARSEEVLDGLVDLFLAEGFRRFTLADMATRMHCSKSTLYALGHSKEQVVLNVLTRFFERATEQVEAQTAAEVDDRRRVVAYLRAMADALRPASMALIEDIAAHPTARAVYERNTAIAAGRVAALIEAGAVHGSFREADPRFVADVVTATMTRIQRGEVARATGLSDAEAYDELAELVIDGISS